MLTALAKLPADRCATAAEFARARSRATARGRTTTSAGPRRDRRAGPALARAAARRRRRARGGGGGRARRSGWPAAQRAGRPPLARPPRPAGQLHRPLRHLPRDRARRIAHGVRRPGRRERHPARGAGPRRPRGRGCCPAPRAATPRSSRRTAGGSASSRGPSCTRSPLAGGTPVLWPRGPVALPSGAWLADGRIVYAGPDFKMMAVAADGGNPVVLVPAPKSGGLGYPAALLEGSSADPDPVRQHLRRAGGRGDRRRTQAEDTLLPAPPRPRSCPTAPSSPCAATARSWPPRSMPAGTASPARRRRSSPASRSRSGSFRSSPSRTTAPWSTSRPTPSPARPPWPRWTAPGTHRVLDPGWQAPFISADLSPDGRRIAVSTLEGAASTLWVKQLDAGPLTRLTFTTGAHQLPGRLAPRRPRPELQLRHEGRHPPVSHPGRRQRQGRAPLPRRLGPDR